MSFYTVHPPQQCLSHPFQSNPAYSCRLNNYTRRWMAVCLEQKPQSQLSPSLYVYVHYMLLVQSNVWAYGCLGAPSKQYVTEHMCMLAYTVTGIGLWHVALPYVCFCNTLNTLLFWINICSLWKILWSNCADLKFLGNKGWETFVSTQNRRRQSETDLLKSELKN